MKNHFLVLVFVIIASVPMAQNLRLNESERDEILDIVVPILQECIANFDGRYVPGTTIANVNKLSYSRFEVKGRVSYRGEQCGLVSNTEYVVTIYKEGSQSFGQTCLLTPYCLWGVVTSREWDCECRKWQYGRDNAAKGAFDILLLLQKISENQ